MATEKAKTKKATEEQLKKKVSFSFSKFFS